MTFSIICRVGSCTKSNSIREVCESYGVFKNTCQWLSRWPDIGRSGLCNELLWFIEVKLKNVAEKDLRLFEKWSYERVGADLGDEVVVKCYRHRILLVLWIPSYRPQMTSKALNPALEIPYYASFATVSTMIPGFSLVSIPSVPSVCKDEWVRPNCSVHYVGKFQNFNLPVAQNIKNYVGHKEFWVFCNFRHSIVVAHTTVRLRRWNNVLHLPPLATVASVQSQGP